FAAFSITKPHFSQISARGWKAWQPGQTMFRASVIVTPSIGHFGTDQYSNLSGYGSKTGQCRDATADIARGFLYNDEHEHSRRRTGSVSASWRRPLAAAGRCGSRRHGEFSADDNAATRPARGDYRHQRALGNTPAD